MQEDNVYQAFADFATTMIDLKKKNDRNTSEAYLALDMTMKRKQSETPGKLAAAS